MEIYDYVEAYNSLVFSADGNMVYNPTLVDVWFDVDGKLYKNKSGERIVIEKTFRLGDKQHETLRKPTTHK